MANELKHKTVGTELTQVEFEDVELHVFDGQEQGDILYALSSTQLSRLVHGEAGLLLQTGGHGANPAWSMFAPYRLGVVADYITGWGYCGAATATALVANYLYSSPLFLPATMTFDRIALNVTVSGGAGKLIRLGIYQDNGSNAPSALTLDAGTIAADSVSFQAITINQQLTPGLWWLVAITDGTPTVSFVNQYFLPPRGVGAGCAPYVGCYTAQAYGALPNPHTTPVPNTGAGRVGIQLRIASIP